MALRVLYVNRLSLHGLFLPQRTGKALQVRLVEQRPRLLHRAGANGTGRGEQQLSKIVVVVDTRSPIIRGVVSKQEKVTPCKDIGHDASLLMTQDQPAPVESLDIEDGSALLGRDERSATTVPQVETSRGSEVIITDDVTFLQRNVFGAPAWAWLQLACAVLAISTAGIAFNQLPGVPPLRLASWRMQATSVVLFTGAWREWQVADVDVKRKTMNTKTVTQLLVSGVCLGVHFGLWVVGLQNTSLAHSLLLVSCTPLFLAFGGFIMGFSVSTGELAGSALGVFGVALVATDAGSNSETESPPTKEHTTWQGDIVSLGASVVIIGYMTVGQKLRKWMPTFLYAAPVTGTAAVFLSLLSLVVESDSSSDSSRDSSPDSSSNSYTLFGWLLRSKYFVVVTYLALVPGLIGHTGYNGVLRFVSPLIVSTSLTFEPLLGSGLGFLSGVADAPGVNTLIGGVLIVMAVLQVIVASATREASEA